MKMDCSNIQELMSPFIDSMASAEEAERVELHLAQCPPCQRQLQSYISLRSLMARVEPAQPPPDFILDTRVKLSRARHRSYLDRFESCVNNVLKPVAIPAVLGASVTTLLFAVLLAGLVSTPSVMAQNIEDDVPVPGLHEPVRPTDPTIVRFAQDHGKSLGEPVMILLHISNYGRVVDYQIIDGPRNPKVEGWIKEMLSLAGFTPATVFGRPVDSTIILSFVAVKS